MCPNGQRSCRRLRRTCCERSSLAGLLLKDPDAFQHQQTAYCDGKTKFPIIGMPSCIWLCNYLIVLMRARAQQQLLRFWPFEIAGFILPLQLITSHESVHFSGIMQMTLFFNCSIEKSKANQTRVWPLQLLGMTSLHTEHILGGSICKFPSFLFSLITLGSYLFWNSNKYNVNINKKAVIQVTYFQWCEHKYILVHLHNKDLSQRVHVSDCKTQSISSKHLK